MLDILKNFLNNYAVPFVLRLICAALLLFVGFKLIRTLMRHIQKRAYFTRLDQNVQIFIKNALRILLDTLLIITAVQVLGVPGATVITALMRNRDRACAPGRAVKYRRRCYHHALPPVQSRRLHIDTLG